MKLTEHNNKRRHYFTDEQGRWQGQYKDWFENGQPAEISYRRNNKTYGEYKFWNQLGDLIVHTFDIDGKEIINFLENPELYPETPEDKTYFALKYGNAPLIGDK